VLLAVLSIVFFHGHPFERKNVAIVSAGAPIEAIRAAIAPYQDIRLHEGDNESIARAKIATRTLNLALVVRSDRVELISGPRDELFARGIQTVLPSPARLTVIPVPRWGYVHYLFPGLLALTVLTGGILGLGYGLVRYRQSLFLKKLSTTPLRRSTFILSQLSSRSTLVFVQVALLALLAHLALDLPLSPLRVVGLALLTLLGLQAFCGVGFLLACFIRNETAMMDALNVIMAPLVLLSEVFFSADELPTPFPTLSAALPSTQLVRLYRAVLLHGETDPGKLATGLLILTGWTVVTYAASLYLFRWHD
jgi:ABC-2 type transport system permease protein